MVVAKANGRLKREAAEVIKTRRKHLLRQREAGEHTQAELAELSQVSRTTVYQEPQRRSP
jgi:DNA-binding XRE family transcriptional regulator